MTHVSGLILVLNEKIIHLFHHPKAFSSLLNALISSPRRQLMRTTRIAWLIWSLNATILQVQSFLTRTNACLTTSRQLTLLSTNDNNDCTDDKRRQLFQSAAATAATLLTPAPTLAKSTEFIVPTPKFTLDLYWPIGKVAFSLLPLAGTSTRRKTIQKEIVRDTIWTHDQIQGIVNVNVPVRQTVVKLSNGGLWVHNPVAPTRELLNMMNDLEAKHGPIRHIVLGTVALEHKATFTAFASKFPNATVWIQPGQWAFPIDVPIEFYGLVQRGPRLRELPVPGLAVSEKYARQASSNPVPEWTADFDYETLGPLKFQSVGAFSETAFYHKSTKSLIVTDIVCSVTNDPPAIIQEDPRALLYHARDNATDAVRDTPEIRRKGWRRMVQFGLVFFPSQIQVRSVGEALSESFQVPPEYRNLGLGAVPGNLYPWAWNSDDADVRNFQAIAQNGKLFCPPILTKLILDREPDRVLAWVDRVSDRFRDMQRIIPGHLNNDIKVSGSREFSQAFDPLRARPDKLSPQGALAEDLGLLQSASDVLTKYGVVAPSRVCDGEAARVVGRFARREI